jgi:tetratricopeptide (TPR) repeat protein
VSEARVAISLFGGSDARPFVSLALALHKMGNLNECAELVNYAMPRFPSQTEFLLLHGFLSEYSYNFDIAQNNYKRILLLKPDDVEALKAIASLGEKIPPTPGASATSTGTVISLKDMTKEVAKIMQPLIQEYPENLPLREALGRVYLKARLMKEAKAQFSEIYAQDFEYPNIRRLLLESSEELAVPVVPKNAVLRNDKNLEDSLVKTFAELRKNADSEEYDDLGRYLIHYGVTFKDFFSKYSVNRFERIDENTFSEKYNIASFKYHSTVYFDAEKKFYATRAIVEDTSDVKSLYYISDLFGHFFKKETGLLGEGVVVESATCDGDKWSGIIWTSRDNFELLIQSAKEARKIYMLRLSSKRFSDTGNLCSYVPVLKAK